MVPSDTFQTSPSGNFMTEVDSPLGIALADRYSLEGELGRGGMATVWLARDLKHDRQVALKVMHPELAATVGPERFLREIHTTAALQHPHILPVLDSGRDAGLLWYTMPYVQGESLRRRLDRDSRLPLEMALDITRQAALALNYAHRHGVIHRDVKPENILLSDDQALVADFGIAKALGEIGSERLTGTGLTVGTPAYMSPEQAAGGQADARSDIYALGCVLYEMLAGEAPFTGPTPQAAIARRVVENAPSVRLLRAAVPAGVEAAVAEALAREPADRFQTAAAFAEALASAATSPTRRLPVAEARGATPPPSTAGRRRFLGMPTNVALLALGFLLGLGGLFAWLRSSKEGGRASTGLKLAVLPFEYLGDTAEAYYADGVSDAVRGKLAALPGLQVIAGASSGEYRLLRKRPARSPVSSESDICSWARCAVGPRAG